MNTRTARKAAKKAARKAAKKAARTATRLLPLLATGITPSAYGTPGDLDPAFGDVGRLGPILDGPAWSIEQQDDGSILLGGGDSYFYYYYYYWTWQVTTDFVGLVSDTGVVGPTFVATEIGSVQVFGVTRQPDGGIVAAGRRVVSDTSNTRLVVFRLLADGSLDIAFGDGGWYEAPAQTFGTNHAATSVVLEPDGRIVVAGSRDDNLIVLRLLPDGTPDDSFGTEGVFEGPPNFDYSGGRQGARTDLLRTASGGYRVAASTLTGCEVVALAADGTLDGSFGTGGIATVATPAGSPAYCNSMATQADGRLLIAGTANSQGFAARLLENGQPDASFSAGMIQAAMAEATAIGAGNNGSVVVAGNGDGGLSIVRLLADGELDVQFGQVGRTTVDLRTDGPASAVVHDMLVQDDDSIVAAGGVDQHDWSSHKAFVIRLLGDSGDSPGVLGINEQSDVMTAEIDGEAVINVRRTGGRNGAVSVFYQSVPTASSQALAGIDYTAVSGTLTWGDGDTAEQQIHVPILADDVVERFETFRLVLTGSEGGAGPGASGATIVIAPDGAPHGQIGFPNSFLDTPEHQVLIVPVSRDYYDAGSVSVTLTPISGSALAGEDFVADPVTVTWEDGEVGWKNAVIPIVDDTTEESVETFTIELSNPTGGAVLGPASMASVHILASDRTPVRSSSGGGVLGWLSLLLLGALRLLRRATKFSRREYRT